jgi:phosphatidate cytidylyltransferase
MGQLTKRIIVAVFGIPLIFFLTFQGGWYFFSLIVIIAVVSQLEFYQIQKKKNINPQIVTGIITGLLILSGVQLGLLRYTAIMVTFTMVFILAGEMFRNHRNASANIGVTMLGIFYIPFFLSSLIFLRAFSDEIFTTTSNSGFKFIIVLLASIWICDTFAYSFGSKIGRHKLFEKVSPNKSMEGAIAGLVGSLLTYGMVKFFGILPIDWLTSVILGLVVGFLGQIGDLVESWFKRDAGVKDTSALLPGHGGMLDRFDSLIFISPIMFITMQLLYSG